MNEQAKGRRELRASMKTCQGSLFEDMLRECLGCLSYVYADAVWHTVYHHLRNKGGEKRSNRWISIGEKCKTQTMETQRSLINTVMMLQQSKGSICTPHPLAYGEVSNKKKRKKTITK